MNKIKSFNLKPCPFCGNNVSLTITPLWNGGHGYQDCYEYSISCEKCGCTVGGATSDTVCHSESDAIDSVIKAWNRRAENGKRN